METKARTDVFHDEGAILRNQHGRVRGCVGEDVAVDDVEDVDHGGSSTPFAPSDPRDVSRGRSPFRRAAAVLPVALLVTAVAFVVSASLRRSRNAAKPTLQAKAVSSGDSTRAFKIVQIADIHLGEAEDLDWGPEQDRKTWTVIDNVIEAESPDLIVLSGDQLTANNCRYNATQYYELLGQRLSNYATPWALIFGNHDDTDYEDETTGRTYPAKYKRDDLLAVDRRFRYSLTQHGPDDVFGTSNYVLDITHGNGSVLGQIDLFDTGGGSIPKQITQEQINWIRHTTDASVPAVAFQHIPTNEFVYHQADDSAGCVGSREESGIEGLVDGDAGIVSSLMDMGNVHFLAVGHQHGNDYCCRLSDNDGASASSSVSFHVCFARHSGYGGYGTWDRGARVYELQFDEGAMTWQSWVRMESGEVIHEVNGPKR